MIQATDRIKENLIQDIFAPINYRDFEKYIGDYYEIEDRDSNLIYARYGKNSFSWWYDISRDIVGYGS